MGTVPPIDRDSARAVLRLLSTVDAPLSEADARALIAEQRWTIDAELPGKALEASGNWPGGKEAVSFAFKDGNAVEMDVRAFVWFHYDPQAQLTALDVFAMLVREATDLFGERAGETLSPRARAWWMLPGQALSISRGQAAATITWSSHQRHKDLLRSTEEEGERPASLWEPFEKDLARELPVLGELETIRWKANGRSVQLQQDRRALGLSVVGNEYLPPERALTAEEQQKLARWGWQAPDAGDSNWHIELEWPITSPQGGEYANLLCRTMRLILGVAGPGDIDTSRGFAHDSDPRTRNG